MQRADVTKGQSEILDSLNDAISRLSRLNKNLLLLSKIGYQDFGNKQSIIINHAIEKNLEFFREQAAAKNISIKIELNDGVDLFSNPMLFEILVSNLFLNAIRHNHMNGSILVSLTDSKMTFINTGKPSALLQDKLFKRFAKTDPSESGNGLGLAIVKKIADMNGWTISYSFSNNLHSFSVLF
jgi:signal transduction histidine kinase